MRLLIVTQAVDLSHPVLGFFHRWIEEFAKHFEHIHVIALQTGEYDLPKNVTVRSLGKEKGANRLHRVLNLASYLLNLHKNYDVVFVHMNPEYIVLAGWWWRLTGKKIGLWYNHTVGSVLLKIAQPFTNVVFHTSPYAYTARYKNAERMPAGIDTEVFKPLSDVNRRPKSVYFQGRIAPAKNVHILLEAFARLFINGLADQLTLVGPEDAAYTKPLKERYAALIERGAVSFHGPVPNRDTPPLFVSHSLSINLTAAGNYDKTVLESLACGTPCIVASNAFSGVVPDAWILRAVDADALAAVVCHTLVAPQEATQQHVKSAQHVIAQRESLIALGNKLKKVYET